MNQQFIFLIGFMGVGKTTLGKRLANKIHLPFYDLDHEIEKETTITIPDFFERYGEPSFRLKEREVFDELITKIDSAVVSLGGGFPCFFDSIDVLNKKGKTLYLHRPEKELYKRLIDGKRKRPLLNCLTDEELLPYIESEMKEREVFYNQAQIKVTREYQKVEDILKLIQE